MCIQCLAVEHFVGLYVFVTYLEDTDFLFDRQSVSYQLDFHGSFYAGIVSFACSLLAALVVYMDESISKAHREAVAKDTKVGYMLPEEFMLYDELDGWNMMDGYQYDDEGEDIAEQGDISRFVCRTLVLQILSVEVLLVIGIFPGYI